MQDVGVKSVLLTRLVTFVRIGLWRSGKPFWKSAPMMGAVSLALQVLTFPLRLRLFLPPPRLLRKPDALRLPLVHSPLRQKGVSVRGSRRASPAWALVRSQLPPPAVRWERRGWFLGDASDLVASSLPGFGVAGSSRSQESLVLAAPSSVASSASAERGRR